MASQLVPSLGGSRQRSPSLPFDHDEHSHEARESVDLTELSFMKPAERAVAETTEVQTTGAIRSKKSLHKRWISNKMSRFWVWEVLACLFSLVLLAVIAAILATFNGRAVPDWPLGIQLGTLVSLLATIATFALTIPIAEGISQIKWLWFRHERPISDFGVIDEAGRDPFGSLKLLLKRRGGIFAAWGAILMILTLAIAPFAQQTVGTETRLVNSTIATIPTAIQWAQADPAGDIISNDVDLTVKAAILNGLLNYNASPASFDVQPDCPTGNCTWSNFQSLAICSQCEDITKQLSTGWAPLDNKKKSNISLPDGFSLSIVDFLALEGFPSLALGSRYAGDYNVSNFEGINSTVTLLNFEAISGPAVGYDENEIIGPFAGHCVLYACVREYTANVTNGVFVEEPLDTKPIDPVAINVLPCPDCTESNITGFGIDYTTWNGVMMYFDNEFNGTFQGQNGAAPGIQFSTDTIQAIFRGLNDTKPNTLDKVMENLAKSITQNMRSNPGVGRPLAVGTAYIEQSFVSVQWGWFALPVAIMVLVLLFLFVIWALTHKADIQPWKSSTMATLFHGLDNESRREIRGVDVLEDMDEAAKSLLVTFTHGGAGGRNLQATGHR